MLLHNREGAVYRVEIEPAIDLQAERENADRRLRRANKELEGRMPDESCHGDFDFFGDFFSAYHEVPPCRKGVPIDGFNNHSCDLEIFMKRKSERDRMERQYDFMNCYNDPTQAYTVYPLTMGRVLSSCIRDNKLVSPSNWR